MLLLGIEIQIGGSTSLSLIMLIGISVRRINKLASPVISIRPDLRIITQSKEAIGPVNTLSALSINETKSVWAMS